MYLVNPITTTTPLYRYERQFAICESCFWCATIFYIATEQRQAHLGNSTNNNNNASKYAQHVRIKIFH
jgi:hypothetical protein